jgi:glutathione S-transferase
MPLLHHMQVSGNSYKVRLCARQVGFECALKDYPHDSGLTRTPEFLAKNPNGRVPLLEFEDGGCLAESDAILWYLAEETALVPALAWDRAKCLEWMFFEQYSHEPYVAVTRNIMTYLPKEERAKRAHALPDLIARGNAALGVMETHLAKNEWFAGARYSIADIALYAYTHVANEGGYDLARYPAVSRWLKRVAEQPGYIALSANW